MVSRDILCRRNATLQIVVQAISIYILELSPKIHCSSPTCRQRGDGSLLREREVTGEQARGRLEGFWTLSTAL